MHLTAFVAVQVSDEEDPVNERLFGCNVYSLRVTHLE